MTPLKTINYRGGVARFRIPAHWVEEYQPAGGGTFYEDGPDTGTFRICTTDASKPRREEHDPVTPYDFLKSLASSGVVDHLPNGTAISRSSKRAVERGEQLLCYTWKVCVGIGPAHFRIVLFTYTILANQEHESRTKQDLEFLDEVIIAGDYPTLEGESGDHFHKS